MLFFLVFQTLFSAWFVDGWHMDQVRVFSQGFYRDTVVPVTTQVYLPKNMFPFTRIDNQYAALKQKVQERNIKLADTLALYNLHSQADMVSTWVQQHVSELGLFPIVSSYKQ